MFNSLRILNFRIYFFGGLVANTGTWIQRVAQDWLVLELSGNSPIALGLTTAFQFTPMVVLGLFAGAIADRISKRALIAIATIFQLIVSAALGILVISDTVEIWHVFLLAFLFGIGSALEIPTRQAFISELVPNRELPNAVSLNSASFNAARIVGPAIGGLLIGLYFNSTGPLFLVHAASMLATSISLLLLKGEGLHDLVPKNERNGRLIEVFSSIRRRPDLLLVLAIMAVAGIFGLNYQMMIALLSREVFQLDATGFGAMSSLMAIGAFAGALHSAQRSNASLRLLVTSSTVFGALIITNAYTPNVFWFGVSLFVLGYVSLTVLTAATSLMQLSTSPAMRGRTMGLFVVVMFAGLPIGGPLIGVIAELFGIRFAIATGGLACVAVSMVGSAVTLRNKGISLTALKSDIFPITRQIHPPDN